MSLINGKINKSKSANLINLDIDPMQPITFMQLSKICDLFSKYIKEGYTDFVVSSHLQFVLLNNSNTFAYTEYTTLTISGNPARYFLIGEMNLCGVKTKVYVNGVRTFDMPYMSFMYGNSIEEISIDDI